MGWTKAIKPSNKKQETIDCFRSCFLFLVSCFLFTGCKYSFTGAVERPDIKTITIEKFPNNALLVNAALSQSFTEQLRDKFLTQSRLSLVPSNGDLYLSGSIIEYSILPQNVQANNVAAQNKLTITVKVKFVNTKYPDESWEQQFSNFALFDASADISTVEAQLIQEVGDRLSQDIFNKALAGW